MARNKYEARCYQCGLTVKAGTGHFERHNGGWWAKHANVAGDGRITCKEAGVNDETETRQTGPRDSYRIHHPNGRTDDK